MKRYSLICLIMIILSMPAYGMRKTKVVSKPQKWGISGMQGYHRTMDDTYSYQSITLADAQALYFAIFDGHGGPEAAKLVAQYAASICESKYNDLKEEHEDQSTLFLQAFIESFKQLDGMISAQSEYSGTTAVCCVLLGTDLHIAWAGDSRALVVCPAWTIKQMTQDHRLTHEAELAHIKSGGIKHYTEPRSGCLRVGEPSNSMAPTRALGDKRFKLDYPEAVLALPAYTQLSVNRGDLVILACDGVWDVLSNEEAIVFVREHLELSVEDLLERFPKKQPATLKEAHENGSEESLLKLVARGLRDHAKEKGSVDDISVLIVLI